MSKDYYKILGVEKNASKEDIKKAYKKLAKKYHPDLNKDPDAQDTFKEINEAASVLGDEQKRHQYDQFGSNAFKQGGSGESEGFGGFGGFQGFDFSEDGVGMEDLFDMFFGGSRRRGRNRGSDLRYNLDLTLEEAAFGAEKTVAINKRNPCSECHGSGGETDTCSDCHGTGYVRIVQRTPFGSFQSTGPCRVCSGTGKIVKQECKKCYGDGYTSGLRNIKVDVPKGIDEGTRLRVAGEGDIDARGQEPGDLYLFITVKEHEFFKRDGNDINIDIPISYIQAVFGDEVEVPTLNGKAKLKIPKGTQSGTIFRMGGKGIPYMRGHGSGDQNVHVGVDVPKKLNAKQQEALEKFAKSIGDDAKPQKGFFKKLFG